MLLNFWLSRISIINDIAIQKVKQIIAREEKISVPLVVSNGANSVRESLSSSNQSTVDRGAN